ncbi:hypothetical protein [Sediminicoccus rosea]|uniref:Uncharacterized protein n=1 Tax=Sediminicoccus rosea TaxID=1225128 RepID=A0ABZ0PD81_9PROT|nr:hypothetical protein [Sediminicoccus rosea]WPB83659.1 hypothetical protein R9Z33_16280 [Sediminicoccus rosea]
MSQLLRPFSLRSARPGPTPPSPRRRPPVGHGTRERGRIIGVTAATQIRHVI